jgi:putative tricarboxylic transport membrane protein
MSRVPKDLPFGLVLCAVGGAVASVARALPSIAAQAYGPGFFPSLVGLVLAGCGLIMVVRSLLQMRGRPAAATAAHAAFPNGGRNLAAIAWVVGGLALIAFGMQAIGFLICVPVFMVGYMVIVGERLLWSVVLSLGTTGIAYYAFARLLKVQIPMGVLQGLF